MTALRDGWAQAGARVAFVPTMGALHAGHISLVQQARARADKVVVSIFVNPTQFGPNEDFAKYPRTLQADMEQLADGADAVFLPTAAMMYPDGYQTYVHNKAMALTLDGPARPGHFEGVCTVVLKLFNIVRPDVAIFGKKDYQQWRILERMTKDLNLRLEIVGADTMREPDGLAMSSRNRYLTAAERQVATKISAALFAAKKTAATDKKVDAVLASFAAVIKAEPGIKLEYAELRRAADLKPFEGRLDAPGVLLVAARVGTTRLIDNLELE